MLKKAAFAVLGLGFAMSFVSQTAAAQVSVGVSVGTRHGGGTVVVGQPAPVVVEPAPIVVEAPPPTVVYDEPFFVSHNYIVGFHDGWYYDHGTRYWVDRHHRRHYDERFRTERVGWMNHHHDNGWHGERGPGHDNGWHNGERHEHGRGYEEHADNRGHGEGHGHGHDR